MKKKVVIIGAGPAGLTMAKKLLEEKEKFDVVIVEESSDMGGISKTVKYNGNRMDIGGHRFFSKDDRIVEFWNNLLPLQGKDSIDDKLLNREKKLSKNGPDPEKIDKVMLVRQRISRIYYRKKFFDYPISMKLQTIKNLGFFLTIKAGFSYLKACMFKRKENNLEDFYINRFGKTLYSMFFEKYTEKLWGRHPSEIDASWGAQRVKGISIKAVLKDMFNKKFGNKNDKNTETSLIEEFYYPKFGPGQLWETLAESVKSDGAKIILNHKVKKYNIENNQIKSVVCATDKGEETIEGDIFVSSMPLNDLIEGIDEKDKTPEISEIAKGLPFRDFLTVGLLVKKLNLKNETNIKTFNNIVPDCWVYVQEPDVKILRFQIFNNWSPYMVKDFKDYVWLGLEYTCNENDEFWNMSDDEFIDFATNELVSMKIINKEDVIDSHREKIKKAYPAYFDTYKDIDKLIEYLNSIKNLYCIGRNGQHRYNNMDHSMLTAFECADNIKNGIESKDNIWKVNTEKDYHENKQ